MAENELNMGKSRPKDEWQEVWDDVYGLYNREKILGGRDPKSMTEEEIDLVYDQELARRLDLLHRVLFPPASSKDLQIRVDYLR